MLTLNLKLLSLVIFLSLFFNGCSQKEAVFKTKLICHEQSIFDKPTLEIYVADEDIDNAKDFIKANDSAHANYKEQVLRNNERCERLDDEN